MPRDARQRQQRYRLGISIIHVIIRLRLTGVKISTSQRIWIDFEVGNEMSSIDNDWRIRIRSIMLSPHYTPQTTSEWTFRTFRDTETHADNCIFFSVKCHCTKSFTSFRAHKFPICAFEMENKSFTTTTNRLTVRFDRFNASSFDLFIVSFGEVSIFHQLISASRGFGIRFSPISNAGVGFVPEIKSELLSYVERIFHFAKTELN